MGIKKDALRLHTGLKESSSPVVLWGKKNVVFYFIYSFNSKIETKILRGFSTIFKL